MKGFYSDVQDHKKLSRRSNIGRHFSRVSTRQRYVSCSTSDHVWHRHNPGILVHQRTLVLHDPSTIATTPSWLLRNILYYLSTQHGVRRLRVILLRDGLNSCRVFDAILSGPPVGEKPKSVGWERNQKGVLASRVADLGATMDPTK